jgi:CubicO group peptidase (beta-lactamase class C family)
MVDMDEELGAMLPELETIHNLGKVPLWIFLAHASGLPAYRELFRCFPPRYAAQYRQDLVRMIMDVGLENEPGTRCTYSDLGYILLGYALEQRLNMRLDRAFARLVSQPLGLEDRLFFLPLGNDAPPINQPVAATEDCPWRGKVIQGQVHDEHAWIMGGVAGHAGLFGTLEGVMGLCAYLLDLLQGRATRRIFSRRLLIRAATPPWPERTWTLGFDRPSPGASSAGRLMSAASLGHLGYTGTSFWLDPEREILVTLLTNRVHPTRKNTKIRAYRPWFHDQIGEWLAERRL